MKYLKIYEDFDPFAHLKDVDFREDKKKQKILFLVLLLEEMIKLNFLIFHYPLDILVQEPANVKLWL